MTRTTDTARSSDPGPTQTGTRGARLTTIDTPVGPFTAVVTDTDSGPAVLASGWTGDVDDLLPLIARQLRPDSLRRVRSIDHVTDAVVAFHDGAVTMIDAVPVQQRSGEFLTHAWAVLRTVPAGAPVTYTEFAAKAGRPAAIRAAGSACSRNAAALFVPCHRVVPAGGGVGGFRWGPAVKRWLLDHEAAAG